MGGGGGGGQWEDGNKTPPSFPPVFVLPPCPPPGNAWAFAADATSSHKTVLLATFAAAGVLRYLQWYAHGFWPLLAAVLATEVVAAPVMVLADAATQAAGARDTDYGRSRLFGAVGVGVFSPVNGVLVMRHGVVRE